MKRWIKANTRSDIFEDENFVFYEEQGIGMSDTPWSGLRVNCKKGSLAYKHVVEVRLKSAGLPSFNGEPVQFSYLGAEVSHGMRSSSDTLDETREYIAVLEDAVDFAERVNDWLYENPEWAYHRDEE